MEAIYRNFYPAIPEKCVLWTLSGKEQNKF